MPQTKTKRNRKPSSKRASRSANGRDMEVLTLAEAAQYLRLPEADVAGLVSTQGLPGRRIGAEWRFLKSALRDWLRLASMNKSAWKSLAGVWEGDPSLDGMVNEIYRQRGRSSAEDRA